MNRSRKKQDRHSLSRYRHIIDRGWYVDTREGTIGPFLRFMEATARLQRVKKARRVTT